MRRKTDITLSYSVRAQIGPVSTRRGGGYLQTRGEASAGTDSAHLDLGPPRLQKRLLFKPPQLQLPAMVVQEVLMLSQIHTAVKTYRIVYFKYSSLYVP